MAPRTSDASEASVHDKPKGASKRKEPDTHEQECASNNITAEALKSESSAEQMVTSLPSKGKGCALQLVTCGFQKVLSPEHLGASGCLSPAGQCELEKQVLMKMPQLKLSAPDPMFYDCTKFDIVRPAEHCGTHPDAILALTRNCVANPLPDGLTALIKDVSLKLQSHGPKVVVVLFDRDGCSQAVSVAAVKAAWFRTQGTPIRRCKHVNVDDWPCTLNCQICNKRKKNSLSAKRLTRAVATLRILL